MAVTMLMEETDAKVQVTLETITPERAKEILETKNVSNRPSKPLAINRYAEDMAAGRWRVNGESIKFSVNGGILLDGQNRLHACIKSKASFETLVVRNLTSLSQLSMDSGVKRSLGDHLRMKGEKNWNNLAGALQIHYKWMRGDFARGRWGGSAGSLTGELGLEWLKEHPEIRRSIDRSSMLSSSIKVPRSVTGAFFYEASQCSEDASDLFMSSLHTGEGLKAKDPCLTLRNWYIKRATEATMRGRPNTVYCLAVTIKAWNYFVTGRDLTKLRWQRVGSNPETFPEMLREFNW